MKETIKHLLDFVNEPDAIPPVELNSAISEIGWRSLRVVAIKLLNWIYYQRELGKFSPLKLDDRYPWCRNLVHLMSNQRFLQDMITVEEGDVVFLPDLSLEDREKLLNLVATEYKIVLTFKPSRPCMT